METVPAVGIVAEFFALFALTGSIANHLMPPTVSSVSKWLATLRFIFSTELTAKGIFRNSTVLGDSSLGSLILPLRMPSCREFCINYLWKSQPGRRLLRIAVAGRLAFSGVQRQAPHEPPESAVQSQSRQWLAVSCEPGVRGFESRSQSGAAPEPGQRMHTHGCVDLLKSIDAAIPVATRITDMNGFHHGRPVHTVAIRAAIGEQTFRAIDQDKSVVIVCVFQCMEFCATQWT